MLELAVKLVAGLLLAILGFYVVGKLLGVKTKILKYQNIILLLILTIIPALLYKVEYQNSYTLITYLLAVVIYKLIFKQNTYKIMLTTGIFLLLVTVGDIIISTVSLFIIPEGPLLRECWYISLIANILVDLLVVILINIRNLQSSLTDFIRKFSTSKYMTTIIFIVAIIVIIMTFVTNFNTMYNRNFSFVINSTIIALMLVITYIFIQERISLNKLTDKYDTLYQYVQTFETWIENEQLNRHEYKNQLAVIRAMTKEKKVKEKIDSLIETTLNLNEDMVESLKYVPNGGLKGLLYYKMALASNQKINITIDVSKKVEKKLKKLKENQIKDLSQLIGIYFDNAIEATNGLRKKQITLEIYVIDSKLHFVISNNFNKKSVIVNNTEKGLSSKGVNRGNGLYFAKKIIDKNKNLSQEQKVINKYYIQKIMLKI